MNLEVGKIIRTDKGDIAKIVDIYGDEFRLDKEVSYGCFSGFKTISKSWLENMKISSNIIDLIEEDDYIRLTSQQFATPVYMSYGKLCINAGDKEIPIENYSNRFITEVLTKEQYEANIYTVKE